jgi:hypothetical protein
MCYRYHPPVSASAPFRARHTSACARTPPTRPFSRVWRCSHRSRMRDVFFIGSVCPNRHARRGRNDCRHSGRVPKRRGPRRRTPRSLLPLLDLGFTTRADRGLTNVWTTTTTTPHPRACRASLIPTLRRARAYAVLERVLAKGEPHRLVKLRHLGTCPSLINIHTYSTTSLSYTHPSFTTPGIWSSISVPSWSLSRRCATTRFRETLSV